MFLADMTMEMIDGSKKMEILENGLSLIMESVFLRLLEMEGDSLSI